ncbi:hypothetical protein KAX17_01835 [Candidatus Bipolaricaulota bacterium]|nr:hypothetical protein [Candidatus Bipolaricaulota bacterium]
MGETKIPELSDEAKKRIKRIVSHHHGFVPADDDLRWIDEVLRNDYLVLHEQRIIRQVVGHEITKQLLKHRDRLGNLEFERIWAEKIIFRYLTLASMCYRAGISAGVISLCRTAIESGLRERVAEELARQETVGQDSLPTKTLERLCELRDESLAPLIEKASKVGIISEQQIENAFRPLKFQKQSSRRVLDKFIHGDLAWMVEFVESREEDTRVVGARDELEEFKIVADMKTEQIAVEVLKGSHQIAAILYLQ